MGEGYAQEQWHFFHPFAINSGNQKRAGNMEIKGKRCSKWSWEGTLQVIKIKPLVVPGITNLDINGISLPPCTKWKRSQWPARCSPDSVCLQATPGIWLKLAGISPRFSYFLSLLFIDCLQCLRFKTCVFSIFQVYFEYWNGDNAVVESGFFVFCFFLKRGSLNLPFAYVQKFHICFLI